MRHRESNETNEHDWFFFSVFILLLADSWTPVETVIIEECVIWIDCMYIDGGGGIIDKAGGGIL